MTWIPGASAVGTAWLATYLLHSTILLGSAYLLSKLLSRRPEWAESIWKVALVGGLATATAQTGLGVSPLGGQLALGGAPAVVESAPPPGSGQSLPALAEPARAPAAVLPAAPAWRASAPAPAAPEPAEASAGPAWMGAVFAGWLLLALALAAGLVVGWRRLQRTLRTRRDVDVPEVSETVAELRQAIGYRGRLRVSASQALPAPIALGVAKPEICVPQRALTDLSREHRASLLAHELAHVARRDPLWRLVAALMTRALFIQPLNLVAARKLEYLSELACDDFAAAHTRRPLALADCLAEVASWTASPGLAGPAAAMARGRSALAARVMRLVEGGEPPRPLRARRAAVVLPALAVGVCALAAPVVAGPDTAATRRPQVGDTLARDTEPMSDGELERMSERALGVRGSRALAQGPDEDEGEDDDRGTKVAPPDEPAPPAPPTPPTAPSPDDIHRMIPSEEEIRRMIPSEDEIRRMIPSEAEIRRMMPSEEEIRRMIPSEDEIRRMIPSEAEIRRMMPTEEEIRRMIPSEDELRRMIPSEDEIRRMIPSEEELLRSIPSEDELRRMIPSEAELERIIREAERERREAERERPRAAEDETESDEPSARQ